MEQPKIKQIANLAKYIQKKSSGRKNPNQYRLYDITGMSLAIGCMQGGGRQPLILLEMKNEAKIKTIVSGAHGGCEPRIKEKKADVRNTAIAEMIVNGKIPTGKVTMFDTRHRTVSENSLCLTCQTDKCAQQFVNTPINTDFRIRKLTERECFRLIGVHEDDIDKLLKAGISKTQLYKLAGNSIVCDVMTGIFTNLFLTEDKNDELADLW